MNTTRRAPRALAAMISVALIAGGITAATIAAPALAASPVSRVTMSTTGADGNPSDTGDPLIGENTTFTVSFDNIATDGTVGYGPRVDLYLDKTGADGDDGMSFVSATYLGQPVSAQTFIIPPLDPGVTVDNGMFMHPVLNTEVPIPAGYQRGDELVILSLPFGSFTPGQPTVDVQVTAAVSDLADLGVPDGSKDLHVLAQPWFRYGLDPLDDPTTDPPLYGTSASLQFRPALYRLTQTYLGPEGETATGPSYPRSYEVSLDVADGQTITDVDLVQAFTSDIHLVGVTGSSISPAGGVPTEDTDQVSVHWDSVTGTDSDTDASFQYTYWVNQYSDQAAGTSVIDPSTGAATTTVGTASATNKWMAIDPRDNPSTTVPCVPVGCTPTVVYSPTDVVVAPQTSTFTERSLAVQKTHDGDGTVVPGDVVNWTVNSEVSDYFAFGKLSLQDVVSDGLEVDPDSFKISWPGQAPIAFEPSESSVTVDPTNGQSTIALDVSSALARTPGQSGFAIGSLVSTSEAGPSNFTITYSTTVLKSYRAAPVMGSRALSPGDTFQNAATVTGTIATPQTNTVTGTDPSTGDPTSTTTTTLALGTNTVTDGSSKTLKVDDGTLVQSVYARNGVVGVPSGTNFAPGDTVTYRIEETLPVESYENFSITDYFPLPVQKVTSIAGPIADLSGGDTVPAVNGIAWGPANTLSPPAGVPSITTDGTSNSVAFGFGTQDIANQSGGVVVDILVTVQISNDPFADGLLLTNQARAAQTNSFTDATNDTALAQFVLAEPDLQIYKGVATTDDAGAVYSDAVPSALDVTAPGSTGNRWNTLAQPITSAFLADHPFDSSVSNVQAGDVVTYTVVLENTGDSPKGAFDVSVGDDKSDFLVEPSGGYNLHVSDGQGNPVSYAGSESDFFGGGITLDDGSSSGSIPAAATDGSNVVVITYDLQIAGSAGGFMGIGSTGVGTLTDLKNTATVNGWAGVQGGPKYAPVSDDSDIEVTTKAAHVTKQYIGAEQSGTSTNVRVGEHVHYRITVDVPTGHHDSFQVRDQLGAGLAYADQISLDAGGTNASTSTDPSVNGSTLTWDFGTLDNDTGAIAHLVIDYDAAVQDTTSVNAGTTLSNTAWAGDDALADADDLKASEATAPDLTVIEPTLGLTASTDADFPDSGDTVHWTLKVTNTSGYTAYDIDTSTPVPSGVSTPGSVDVSGATGTGSVSGGAVQVSIPSLASGATATITFSTVVGAGNGTGTLSSTSTLTWQSIPSSADHTPRTGTGTGPDDYRTTAVVNIPMSAGGILKTLTGTSNTTTSGTDIAIGETASFALKAQLPEGELGAFSINDTLPAGMVPDPNSVAVSAPGFGASEPNPALTPTISVNGQTISVGFLPVTLPGDNDPAPDFVTVTYDATLSNSASTFDPAAVSKTGQKNTASLVIGSTTTHANSITMRYVQPQWTLSAAPSAASLRPNDPVTYTLKATNTGTAEADASTLVFTIPNAAAAGAAQTVASLACGTTPPGFTCAVAASGNDVVVTYTPDGDARFPANGAAGSPQFTATVTGVVPALRPDSATTFPATFVATGNASSTAAADYVSPATGPASNRVITATATANLAVRIPDPYVALTNDQTVGGNVAAGTTITWTVKPKVTATIHTENVATSVVISPGQTYVSATGTGVSWDPTTSTLTWPATGDLTSGSTTSYTFTTQVVDPAPVALTAVSATATITNLVGGVYLHGTDTNLGDNTLTVSNGVAASPDLLPLVSDGHGPTDLVAPGDQVTYSVSVRNIGHRDTTAGAVTFAIPDGTSFVSADPTEWTPTVVGGVTTALTWSGISLQGVSGSTVDQVNGSPIVVQTNSTIRAGLYSLVGTATTSDPNDVNTANDVASDSAPLGGNPALAITKVLETTGDLTPGTTASWLITVTNSGNRGAEGVTVVDTLPASGLGTPTFSQVSGTPVVTGTRSGHVITWSGGVIEAGSTLSYRVSATLTAPAPAGLEQLVNTATVRENGNNGVSDPAPSYPLSATVTSPLVAAPDDRVTVTNNVTSLTPGTSYTYVVTASDYGNQSESGATMTLALPSGVTPTNLDGGTLSGTGANRIITWTGVSIAGSSDGTTPGTTVHNVAVTIDSPQAAGVTDKLFTAAITTSAEDTDKADNTATDDDPLVGSPDLTIVKTANATTPAPGDTVVYTLTATNSGNRGASGLVFTDDLPAGVTFVSASGNGTESGGIVTWTGGSVAGGGGTTSVTVTVTVNSPVAAGAVDLVNNAGVCDDGSNDPTATQVCDTTSKSLPLNTSPDYAVSLSQNAAGAAPGGQITYTVGVENDGTQDAVGGELTIALPSNATVTDAGGGDISAPGTIVFHGIDLDGKGVNPVTAGGSVSHSFSLQLDSAQLAGVTTVPVSAAIVLTGDSVSTNNAANVSAAITGAPNLVVTKTATPSVTPGGTISWQVTVTNTGDRGASGVTLTDTLPSGIGSIATSAGSRVRNGVTTSVTAGVVTGSSVALSPGTVQVGDSYTYPITAVANAITAAGVESITNSVTFGAINRDNGSNTSTPAQLTATASTAITASPDLGVAITDNRTDLTIGTDVSGTYVVTLTNAGNQNTTTGEATVTLPSWLTVTSGATGTVGPDGTTYVFSNRTVSVGTPTMISIPYTVPAWVAAGIDTAHASASVTNGSTSGTPNEDGTTGMKSATDDTNVIAEPELVLTSQLVGAASAGSSGTWKVSVVNTGTQGATGVEVSSTLPDALLGSYSASPSATSAVGSGDRTFTWPDFSLDPGDPAQQFSVATTMVTPFPAGTHSIDNLATVHDDGTNGAELDLLNNSNTLHVTTADAPNMKVTVDPATVTSAPGSTVTIALHVVNQGTADTTDGVLTATVPDGYTVVPSSNDSDGRVWDAALNRFEWTGLSLTGNSAQTLTRTLVLRVDSPQPAGRTSIVVDATTTTTDDQTTNSADKSASSVLTLAGAPDMRVAQTVDVRTAVEGQIVTWTVAVDDIGPRGASGVTATMAVPEAVDPSTLDTDGGAWDPTTKTITWSIPTVASGAPKTTFTVSGTLLDPLPLTGVTIDSMATVADDGLNGLDTNFANNTASTTVQTGVDLQVKKTLVNGMAVRGQTVTWLITVTNSGPQTVGELLVDEQMPDHLDNITMTPSTGAFDSTTGDWTQLSFAPGDTISLTVSALVLQDAPGNRLVNTVKVTPVGYNVVQLATLAYTADSPLMSPLAYTGMQVAPWIGGVILLLLLIGALLLLIGNRRRGGPRHRVETPLR